MNLDRRISMLLLALGLVLLAGCDEDPTAPPMGLVSVTVVDSSGPPVSGVEIRMVPPGLAATTDAQGVARFQLAPGDYFVDANLCCRGTGLIDYHVPVTVTAGATEAVELQACLFCE